MGATSARVGLLVLAGWLIGALGVPAAQAPAPGTAAPADKRPTTAAPATKPSTDQPPEESPLPGLLEGLAPEVAERIAIVADVVKPDAKRAEARNELVSDQKLLDKGSIEALIALGKIADKLPVPDEDEDRDNVRMHVAIALSQIRSRPRADKVVENYPMLQAWLDGETTDAALRHWAALAVANTRTEQALKILDPILKGPVDGQAITCKAVAKAIGAWRGKYRDMALPVLLDMIASEKPAVRIAGIEGLAAGGVNAPKTIRPLAKIASDDPEEPVWRAAERVLNELTRKMQMRRLIIRAGATDEVRKEAVRVWLFIWEREMKKRQEEKKG
ncbi:MAG: HEAT repeat domain-containing protein [Planctomycetota bacterium]